MLDPLSATFAALVDPTRRAILAIPTARRWRCAACIKKSCRRIAWCRPNPGEATDTFAEEDGRTTLSITILYPSKEAREAAMKTGMTKGMEMSYDRLAAHLETMGGARP
jgi:hypothetical protein